MILSSDFYDELIKQLNHYKMALQRDRELHDLALKVNKSRDSIKEGKCCTEEEFDRMMETIL